MGAQPLSQAVEVVGPPWLADIDGIGLEADGTLQATSGSETEFEILGGAAISSANHGFSRELGLALIPTGFDNQVIVVRVDARPPTAGD